MMEVSKMLFIFLGRVFLDSIFFIFGILFHFLITITNEGVVISFEPPIVQSSDVIYVVTLCSSDRRIPRVIIPEVMCWNPGILCWVGDCSECIAESINNI